MNPFELFSIPPAFELDLPALEAQHRELSRVLHPDRYVGSPAGERRQALGRAIEVNEAWRTLKAPIARAEALCELLGVGHGETKEPPADPSLLMEMMEQREALSDARRAKDLAAVEQLATNIAARQKEVQAALSEAFAPLLAARSSAAASSAPADSASPATSASPPAQHTALLRKLGELRYYRRFLDEANAILDEIE